MQYEMDAEFSFIKSVFEISVLPCLKGFSICFSFISLLFRILESMWNHKERRDVY